MDDQQKQQWFTAAKKGDAKFIIQNKAQIQCEGVIQDVYFPNNTALIYAALNNQMQCASVLLTLDRGRQNRVGWTALHAAAFAGHTKIVNLLKPFEQNMTTTETYKEIPGQATALQIAIQTGCDGYELLLEEQKVARLSQQHLNAYNCIEQNYTLVESDSLGRTPLHYLALSNKFSQQVYLSLSKLYQNKKDVLQKSALMLAAERNNVKFIQAAIQNESELHIQTNMGLTALMLAAQSNRTEAVQLLKKYEMKIQSVHGLTALMLAAKNGNIQSVNELLEESKCQTTHEVGKLCSGSTALMFAKYFEQSEVVKILDRTERDIPNVLGQKFDQIDLSKTMLKSADYELRISQVSDKPAETQRVTQSSLDEYMMSQRRCIECEKTTAEAQQLKERVLDLQKQLDIANKQFFTEKAESDKWRDLYMKILSQVAGKIQIEAQPDFAVNFAVIENTPLELKELFDQSEENVKLALKQPDVIQLLYDQISLLKAKFVSIHEILSDKSELESYIETAKILKLKVNRAQREADNAQEQLSLNEQESAKTIKTLKMDYELQIKMLTERTTELEKNGQELKCKKEQLQKQTEEQTEQIKELKTKKEELELTIRMKEHEDTEKTSQINEKDEKIKKARTDNLKIQEQMAKLGELLKEQQKGLGIRSVANVVQRAEDK
ncbi:Ankyrin_repeat-containing protein [Hexamita inflata]|uniref:Ankyrin repeat-containing protein n=1 Tax=Hexamita inflata TaxID=28002 RepID=A0AA86UV71_9EUKA|nr:Ankyrin repeat-containing protein [Hexamita inflata]